MNSRLLKNTLITAGLLLVIIGGGYMLKKGHKAKIDAQNAELIPVEEIKEVEKKAQVVSFGEWIPTKERSLLGQIESQGDTVIPAQLSGTVKNVYVDLGDRVSRGQVLAEFDRTNDQTQVAYQNALLNLETTKLSVQNSIASAEEQLRSAQRNLEQSKALEGSRAEQNYEAMVTTAQNAETTASQALEWVDKTLGVSIQYKNIVDPKSRQIGEGHKILRQLSSNQTADLLMEQRQWQNISLSSPQYQQISFAEDRLAFLREMRDLLSKMDEMIRIAPTNRNFLESDRSAYLGRSEGYSSAIDGIIAQLEQAIKGSQTTSESNNSTLINAQNGILQARAGLELTKAQGEAQIQGAQNQIAQSRVSLDDLTIRSPFAGEITDVMVQLYQTVSPGTQLFSVLSEGADPKVVLNVTAEELGRIKSTNGVMLTFENKTTRFVEQARLSTKVNTQNQKIEVEFVLDELPEGVLIGEIVTVNVPVEGENLNLLPLSSVSFEPGGAEVLVITKENLAVRKVVQVGTLLGDGIEIVNGLEQGDMVVQYRSRVTSGDTIKPIK